LHPVLLSFGPFTLYSFGVLTALGFFVSIFLAWRRAPREGVPPDKFLDLAFWAVIGGIAGARALYVLVNWAYFARRPWEAFKLWDGGLVFYGGFIVAVLSGWLYVRAHRLSLQRVLDLAAPYIPLGHAFGRIGCTLNGCCYGRPSMAWGVLFPSTGDGIPRLPTQAFEAGFNLLLFALLLFLRRGRHGDGRLFWLYVAGYALWRFVIEFVRGDEIRGTVLFPWLHTSQLIAAVFFLLAVIVEVRLLRPGRPAKPGARPAAAGPRA